MSTSECSGNITKIEIKSPPSEELLSAFREFSAKVPLKMLSTVKLAVKKAAANKTPIGAFLRVQKALATLRDGKEGQLEFVWNEDLMVKKRSFYPKKTGFFVAYYDCGNCCRNISLLFEFIVRNFALFLNYEYAILNGFRIESLRFYTVF